MSEAHDAYKTPMTKAIREEMTPLQALTRLKEGNKRFMENPRIRKKGGEKNAFIKASACSQNPFALVLSCIDSRVPTEVIFDQNIGDIFNAKVAGNFVNEDILGSMEFSTGYVKLIVVMGHTSCGAIGAACSAVHPDPNAKPSCKKIPFANLGQMVSKLIPAVIANTDTVPDFNCKKCKDCKDAKDCTNCKEAKKFIDDVARINVYQTIENILTRSQTPIRRLYNQGKLMIKGAMYDVETGTVSFLEEQENKKDKTPDEIV